MNRINRFRKGFFIIEAILASVIVGITIAGKAGLDQRVHEQNEANNLGVQVSEVLKAMDTRIFLDGYFSTGTWTQEYADSFAVESELFSKELTAFKNPTCGDPSGWVPYITENESLALLPCNFFNPAMVPMGFKVSGYRTNDNKNPAKIGSWAIELRHSKKKLFDRWFRHYDRVINTANSRKGMRVTGDFNVHLVQAGTSTPITPDECYTLNTQCAILAEYKPNAQHSLNSDSIRVDGSVLVSDNLSFKTGAHSAQCYRMVGTKREEASCGIEVDSVKDRVNANINTLITGSLIAVADSAGTDGKGIKTDSLCVDRNGANASCGMSTALSNLSDKNSIYSRILTNVLYLEEQLIVRSNKAGDAKSAVLSVGRDGDMSIAYNLEVAGEVLAFNDLVLQGGTEAKNVVINDTLNPSGSDESASNFAGNVAVITLDGVFPQLETALGLPRTCSGASLATDSSGELFQCVGGRWLATNYPRNAVLPFSGGCPYGWSKFTALSSGSRIHGTNSGVMTSVRDQGAITLSSSHMAKHRHSFSSVGTSPHWKGGNRDRVISTAGRTSSNGGASRPRAITFRSRTYAANFCKKD